MRFAIIAVALSLSLGRAVAAAGGGWIGLQLEPGAHGGVAVRGVVEGSPGENAKILVGDEVLAVNGKQVLRAEELVAMVRAAPIGALLHLTVAGASGRRSVDVTLAARPDDSEMQRGLLLGRAAPDFPATVRAGASFARLSSLKGQVVLIDFFATWCGPCLRMAPQVERMHHELATRGLRVIGISTESPLIVAGAARRFAMSYPLLSDEDAAISGRFRVYALPTFVVIDRRGVVREISVADIGRAESVVRALLNEK